MLTLLMGKDWIANSDRVMRMIHQDVVRRQAGRVLMVPELISHNTERRLCEIAGDTACRYAEVMTFSRLAQRVSDSVGRPPKECLDNGGRVVAMAAAARQLHSKLKAYASVETRPEFLIDLVNAIDEFKSCCVTPADLRLAAVQTEGILAQKLEELALLYDSYDGLCAQGRRDPRDQMSWLLDELDESTYAQDHIFYFDFFPDFTRQHLAIIEYLIRYSPSVTISINCDCINSDATAFEKTAETAADLICCAQKADIPFVIEYVDDQREQLRPVRDLLYDGSIAQTIKDNGLLTYHTETIYQECTSAANRVLALVRDGARFRDVSIVIADYNTYRNTLEMTLERCNIPAYFSGTESILDKTVTTSVITALEAAFGGFEQHDTLRYLKSVLSPLDFESVDKIENYVILWGINGNRWLEPWQNHPDGLGEIWTPSAERQLTELNALKDGALKPLQQLRQRFATTEKLGDQVRAVYEFFCDIRVSEQLERYAQLFDREDDNRSAQILNQLWEILLSALEQLYDVLGETVWDTQAFIRLFKLLLSQYDVGTIPPVLDAVTVGTVSAMRCQRTKHLIILGVQEGMMPGYNGQTGVLTEQERLMIRQLGVTLNGGSLSGLHSEFYNIFGVFCGAEATITASYSNGQPSFIFKRLVALAGVESDADYALGTATGDPGEAGAYLARWSAMDTAKSLGILDLYTEFYQKKNHTLGSIGSNAIKRLYGECIHLSASQVDRLAECRLAYFLKYGLRAEERKVATIDPAEFGTYVHTVLENTVRDVMNAGGFQKVSLECTLEIAKVHSTAYISELLSQLGTGRIEYLFERNSVELQLIVKELWEELHNSDFLPVAFELAFGEGKEMPAVRFSGKMMGALLRGVVDRVDLWRGPESSYFRVVDYKTGRKDFDYCDIFNGLGLQMLLYLFALEEDGESVFSTLALPAGVQYFPARVPFVSADGLLTEEEAANLRQKEWKRKGLLIRADDVLNAMGHDAERSRIPVVRKSDGSISGDLADFEQFQILKKYVFKLLGTMVDDLASGNVEPNPYSRGTSHNACTYCPYYMICHQEHIVQRRNYKAMNAQRFWEEVEKEVSGNG